MEDDNKHRLHQQSATLANKMAMMSSRRLPMLVAAVLAILVVVIVIVLVLALPGNKEEIPEIEEVIEGSENVLNKNHNE